MMSLFYRRRMVLIPLLKRRFAGPILLKRRWSREISTISPVWVPRRALERDNVFGD